MSKRWEVFFHGGPLHGQRKVYDGSNTPMGATIVQPVMTKEHGILGYEYGLKRRTWWALDAHLTHDPIERALKRKRTMLCFRTELKQLLEKYGAKIEPRGHEVDGLEYTVDVDGKPYSQTEWIGFGWSDSDE